MDRSLESLRALCKRLNNTNKEVNITTFSKAAKARSPQPFKNLYERVRNEVQKKVPASKYKICPIDSTSITLTTKLLWALGHHQVKLFSCLNIGNNSTEGILINFGDAHDYTKAENMIATVPENGVGVMDRGFASKVFIKKLVEGEAKNKKYFVIRLSDNYTLEPLGNGNFKVGKGKDATECRVINFCDLKSRSEYHLATNLPSTGEEEVSDMEVMEIYIKRWQIELLWKFLKMHMKLDRFITKSMNGIEMQIYTTLTCYLMLQLLEIPKMWGDKLLDKLRYLQACMCQEISYVHWLGRILKKAPLRIIKGGVSLVA